MKLKVVPEYSLHAILTIIFLFVADWMTCIINLGLLGYHVYRQVLFQYAVGS